MRDADRLQHRRRTCCRRRELSRAAFATKGKHDRFLPAPAHGESLPTRRTGASCGTSWRTAGEARQRRAPVLDAIAAGVEATAAQTKYALLGALFAARRERAELSGRHLLLGLENELGKEGRAVGPRNREKILGSERKP